MNRRWEFYSHCRLYMERTCIHWFKMIHEEWRMHRITSNRDVLAIRERLKFYFKLNNNKIFIYLLMR